MPSLKREGRPLTLGPDRKWTSLESLRGEREPLLPEVEMPREVSRRGFLQLLGISATAASLDGCWRMPEGKIVPYLSTPVGVTPGEPLHYATAVLRDGLAIGIVATAYEGRPTKIEGNPAQPASLGATSVFEQGFLRTLYDPRRAREFKERGDARSALAFEKALRERLLPLEAKRGAGLCFLLEPSSSPLAADLRRRIAARLPETRFVSWSSASDEAVYEGARLAFGRPLAPRRDLSKADVILSLDDDLLSDDIPAARAFADRRLPGDGMNRLYVAECRLSVTGMMADHRLRLRPSEIGPFAAALLAAVGETLDAPAGLLAAAQQHRGAVDGAWLAALADDLLAHRGASLVTVGRAQPPAVHAAAWALNALLGDLGRSASLGEPVVHDVASGPKVLQALAEEAAAGKVDTLVIGARNPALLAPRDVDALALLGQVPFSVYLTPYEDETSARATWLVPEAHPLEAWGDGLAFDGTATVAQPLLDPLFGGWSSAQLLAQCAGELRPIHDVLRDGWRGRRGGPGFDLAFERWLQRGVVERTEVAPVAVTPDWTSLASAIDSIPAALQNGLELALYRDYRVRDGGEAHNGWLQELPDPVTKQTWGNAALLSPATAAKLDVQSHDVVQLELGGQRVRVPVYLLPGHADGAVSLALGYGGRDYPASAPLPGADASPLRTVAAPWFASGLRLAQTGERERLAVTQEHWRMEGRPIAQSATLAEYRANPEQAQRGSQPSEYRPIPYPGYAWGMAIDLTRCTGCSACIVACAAENNTPVVGKDQVARGREMHWLRLDRYFEGPPDEPTAITMPVMCVQCEDAPCEVVCPVGATVHSDEGLNEMVYNRCVGTRYCSNNCPYKVRRFNFLDPHYDRGPVEKMRANPEVTVRSRGVMEKCSYCVQRIERSRIASQIEGHPIRDGECQTACQQVCPTRAITFGSLNDPTAEVTKLHRDPRAYFLLFELGTRPRTAHLARIKNENPAVRRA